MTSAPTRPAPAGSVTDAGGATGNVSGSVTGRAPSRSALLAALLGFFIVTFDAVVVNIALPTIRADLGSGMAGLQWIVDGYTVMFAAFLLTAGALSDRIGARRAFGMGVGLFTLASLACGAAPTLAVLVGARFAQGCAAALLMPSSMALLSQAHTDPGERARAVALWAVGGGVASTSGPVLGGLLTVVSWRLIFLVNVPVGLLTLLALRRVETSARRPTPVDWVGQVAVVVAMAGLTYGVIAAGADGLDRPGVLVALAVAAAAGGVFVLGQRRVRHPMVPAELLANRAVRVSALVGFAFMVAFYGLPFVATIYLQQERGLSALATGGLFLPMALLGAVLTPYAARIVERLGQRPPVVGGLLAMAGGLVALGLLIGVLPGSPPVALVSLLMAVVGLGGPLVMPPTMAALLNGVPGHSAGIASGVFNTSRQVGGALAVAVFGSLVAGDATLRHGARDSLWLAALVSLLAAAAALRLPRPITTQLQEAPHD